MAKLNTVWQFNLSRAPWWDGQYERIIGLVKQALYKVIGHAKLTWKGLQDVVLDVEDYVQLPILTPNLMITGQTFPLIEKDDGDEDSTEEKKLRKRAKYIKHCKERVWKR